MGGVLHLLKLPKNLGKPGLVRNVGIKFARGKYIAFLDSDDLFTKTALEELMTLAEEYKAEAVHSNQIFSLWGEMYDWSNRISVDDPKFSDMEELTNPNNFYTMYGDRSYPEKPTLETNVIAGRVKNFVINGYTRESYTTFYRRDFVITNQIFFPEIGIFEDEIFTFKAMCLAKKILLVPNIWYIVRPRASSITRKMFDKSTEIHRYLRAFIDGFLTFTNIMDGIGFFSKHLDYRYDTLNWYIQDKSHILSYFYLRNHPAEIYPLVEKEFTSEESPFAAYLFNTMKVQQLQIEKLQAELEKFQQQ